MCNPLTLKGQKLYHRHLLLIRNSPRFYPGQNLPGVLSFHPFHSIQFHYAIFFFFSLFPDLFFGLQTLSKPNCFFTQRCPRHSPHSWPRRRPVGPTTAFCISRAIAPKFNTHAAAFRPLGPETLAWRTLSCTYSAAPGPDS